MRVTFILLGVLVSYASIQFSKVPTLFAPPQAEHVNFAFMGYSNSTHYITPLKVTLRNDSNLKQTFKIANGQILVPDDKEYQEFVVTQELLVDLLPNQERTMPVYAMCINADLMPPDESINYEMGPEASEELKRLTSLIEKNGSYNIEAQSAVWSFFGDRTLEQIAGFDTLLVEELTTMLAETLNVDLPSEAGSDDYSRNYYFSESLFKYTIRGSFRYQLFERSAILIAMFDANNIVVRELYRNNTCTPGHHNIEYNFDATHFDDSMYYVRLLENGEIMLEIEIETPEELRQG
ncbi:MAG: hypothetical protein IH597_14010 [Bacteroidales bacterium]|nr:hypothetical protein [Bacteroidales bacterium]